MQSFSDLQLSQQSLAALVHAGFIAPTPIQAQAIPPALAGKDVIGAAATGTGKTVAFLLPIIERLAARLGEDRPAADRRPGARAPRALILAPTRELAIQIGEELTRFGEARGIRGAVVIGGLGIHGQAQALRAGPAVVVATPGRLLDHCQQGTARLDGIEILVLDEADRMLDMGFKPQLTRILAKLPRSRQTLLFSATMAGEVADFARANLRDPVRIEVARSGTTAARAEQQVFLAGQTEKLPLLLALLEGDGVSTLVFTRTKRRADRVAKSLARAGHDVARIHADRSQGQRRAALDGFKDGTYRVLVATDIAARGIDVAEIGHVVNFDLPHVPEDYVHRVGRTARAAASGRASSFASPEEAPLLRDIERLTRREIPRAAVPRDSPAFQAELGRASEALPSATQHARGRGVARAGPRPARRSPSAGTGNNASQGSGSASATPRLVGSWKPRRGR